MSSHKSSILDYLYDDVLWLICEHLQYAVAPNRSMQFPNEYLQYAVAVDLFVPVQKSPLVSLSLTCKRLRKHCLPYQFQKFTLQCFEDGFWEHAMMKLRDWNPEYSIYVREISIQLRRLTPIHPLPKDFVDELPETLANVLDRISSSSTRLSRITLNIEQTHAQLFEQAFARLDSNVGLGLIFPTVKHLTIGPYNEFIVKRCPNVEFLSDISHNGWYNNGEDVSQYVMNLIKEASTVDSEILKCLGLSEMITADLMNVLYRYVPRIKILVINISAIIPPMRSPRMSFETFVAYLSRFHQLQTLSIPEVFDLGVGIRNARHQIIHTINYEKYIEEQVKQQAQEKRKAEERVALAIFNQCRGLPLKEVWFENSIKATLTLEPGDVLESTPEEVVSRVTTKGKVEFQSAPNDCDYPVWV